MDQRISFITLGVADLARAQTFYEALGWKASAMGEGLGIVFFQVGGLAIALYPREELAVDVGVPAAGDGFRGITLAYNTRSEAEADAIVDAAAAAGGKVMKRPQKVFWGGYSGYFADPDGHLWEVCFNPQITIADDGSITLPR